MKYESLVRELIMILKSECKSFGAVNELLMIEEKCLIDNDRKALEDNVMRQEDVFNSIACLEKSREEVCGRLAERFGRDTGTLTITAVADMVDGVMSRELLDIGHKLNAIQDDIRRRRITNSLLLRQGMMMIESDIRTLVSAFGVRSDTKATYSSKARETVNSGGIRIDGHM